MSGFGLSPEQRELQKRARELAAGPIARRAAEVDRTEQYPWDNVELLKDAKLIGMTIPPQYGGQGKGWLDAVLAIEALSAACAVTGRIAVETNMGAISAVMAYGSEDQKKMAADMVLSGDKPAICITEPDAGSDATSMTTRADRKGNRYVINGRKHWITGGGVSRLHLIFAKVYDEKGNEEGIGGFLAIRDETAGLKITKREPTMGLRGIPEAVIDFEDMELPPSALVMPPRGLKKGFADLMNAYNSQRVGAGTVAMGIAAGALPEHATQAQENEHRERQERQTDELDDRTDLLVVDRVDDGRDQSDVDPGFTDIIVDGGLCVPQGAVAWGDRAGMLSQEASHEIDPLGGMAFSC